MLIENLVKINAQRESGCWVDYGSTRVQLPDEVEVTWSGRLVFTITKEDWEDEEELTSRVMDDIIREGLSDEVVEVEVRKGRASEERRLVFTDYSILSAEVQKNGEVMVEIEPEDFEWI